MMGKLTNEEWKIPTHFFVWILLYKLDTDRFGV